MTPLRRTDLFAELQNLISGIGDLAESDQKLSSILAGLGVDPDTISDALLKILLESLRGVQSTFDGNIAAFDPSNLTQMQSWLLCTSALAALRDADKAMQQAGVAESAKFVESMAAAYLASRYPFFYHLLAFASIVQTDAASDWPRLKLPRIGGVFTNARKQLQDYYLRGGLAFNAAHLPAIADRVFPLLAALFGQLGLPFAYGVRDPNQVDPRLRHMLTLLLAEEVGLTFALSPKDDGNLGLVVHRFGNLWDAKIEHNGWHLAFDWSPASVETFSLHGSANQIPGPGTALTAGFTLSRPKVDDRPAIQIGAEQGAHLRIDSVAFKGGVSLNPPTGKYSFTVELGAGVLDFGGLIELEWSGVELKYDPRNGSFQPRFADLKVFGTEATEFTIGERSIFVRLSEVDLNRLLSLAAPNLNVPDQGKATDVELRVLFSQNFASVEEVSAGWVPSDTLTFALPGIKASVPASTMRIVVQGEPKGKVVALLAKVKKNDAVTFSTTLAWERGEDRDLQSGEENAKETFSVSFTPREESDLLLCSYEPGRIRPRFFRQLKNAIPGDWATSNQSHELASGIPTVGLEDSAPWMITFSNIEALDLPFLKNAKNSQVITVKSPDNLQESLKINENGNALLFPILVVAKIGENLSLSGTINVGLSLETFALKVEHGDGLKMVSTKDHLEGNHLGLKWTLRGILNNDNDNDNDSDNDKTYHYLTLLTSNYDYRLKQATGCELELAYDAIGSEPILFNVKDFELSDKGVSLSATVIDKPARLNGLDTRFRFSDSGFRIVEGEIQDFTLQGTGPLPPALVGEASANIALQFEQRNGKLRLVKGGAEIKGTKLLDCPSTRFRFAVTSLGLKFVDDGRFHLYFTITGSAQFEPAPSDDKTGPLAMLKGTKIELVECPITGDMSVIAQHVNFLIPLPKPVKFPVFGCYEMEIRGVGFQPQASVFGGDGAMLVTGQVKMAQGSGDAATSQIDYHRLYIGLPEKGKIIPRVYMSDLPLALNFGEAFKLNGTLKLVNETTMRGFTGEGTLQIQGMPLMAASFAFLRVRRDTVSGWVRAWFIYIEARRVSFPIPVVKLYIREVGLGFGFRYTLASIKAADEAKNIRELIQELKRLSRTQGNLANLAAWAVDLEKAGEDPRWTVVLRALFSENSAAVSATDWNEKKEEDLTNAYLFDAVVALRSDLTFLMTVRAWLGINYWDFDADPGLRNRPLFSGFVLLSPRQKRLLAHMASNPDNPALPRKPALPELVEKALTNGQFSATLLVEPGLVHYELGWPNQLRWAGKIGPLDAEYRGGFIMRLSTSEFVLGNSFLARASLSIGAGVDLGVVGAELTATAQVAYGARYIGVIPFQGVDGFALYGAVGLEARLEFGFRAWIRFRIKIFRRKITIQKDWRLSMAMDLTTALQVGITTNLLGITGNCTLGVRALGHYLELGMNVGVNTEAVDDARIRTNRFLQMGLEATEVEPGSDNGEKARIASRSRTINGSATGGAAPFAAPGTAGGAPLLAPNGGPGVHAIDSGAAGLGGQLAALAGQPASDEQSANDELSFAAPDYILLALRQNAPQKGETGAVFAILPRGEQQKGFLPPPPLQVLGNGTAPGDSDFTVTGFDGGDFSSTDWKLEHWSPVDSKWLEVKTDKPLDWSAKWDHEMEQPEELEELGETRKLRLAHYVGQAFISKDPDADPVVPDGDPAALPPVITISDPRVHDPSQGSYEIAVLGAREQLTASPLFKMDPASSRYDKLLLDAFDSTSDIYQRSARDEERSKEDKVLDAETRRARQARGVIVQEIVADVRSYAANELDQRLESRGDLQHSVAFLMGLVFRLVKVSDSSVAELPKWVTDYESPLAITQRTDPTGADHGARMEIRVFNAMDRSFDTRPPAFDRVRQFASANTIAFAWDLKWADAGVGAERVNESVDVREDPDHHLLHYQVKRVALDGGEGGVEGEKEITVCTGAVLHCDQTTKKFYAIRPRFQIVDHFNHESLQEQSALPQTGRTYIYTITPVDFGGCRGRSITLLATRYPDEPPPVPVDARLNVTYKGLFTDASGEITFARTLEPEVQVEWTDPLPMSDGPQVHAKEYHLILRKSTTLPVGSYALDSATAENSGAIPGYARPKPDDVCVLIKFKDDDHRRENPKSVPISMEALKEAGPSESWRPESWQVFIQAVSGNRVPSALAPVQVLVRAEGARQGDQEIRPGERQPAELEWLDASELPPLPPEDGDVRAEEACVPMPNLFSQVDALQPNGDGQYLLHPDAVHYRLHPKRWRAIRFRWNQAPSDNSDSDQSYSAALVAGYHLYQLDIDAQTTEVLGDDADEATVGSAMPSVQEVRMAPASDLPLIPAETMATANWEAWYPSTVRRIELGDDFQLPEESPLAAWYSWRESVLVWPQWKGITDVGSPVRDEVLHPFLRQILTLLEELPEDADRTQVQSEFVIEVQGAPAATPTTLEELVRITPDKSDPYGWGILQMLGLSTTITMRERKSNRVLKREEMLHKVAQALSDLENLNLAREEMEPLLAARKHLFVELLFQPGKRFQLKETTGSPEALLAMVQLSLRPLVQQEYTYATARASGPAGVPVLLTVTIGVGPVWLILQSVPANAESAQSTGNEATSSQQHELETGKTCLRLRLPLSGETLLLVRCKLNAFDQLEGMFTVQRDDGELDDPDNPVRLVPLPRQKEHEKLKVLEELPVTSKDFTLYSHYFTVPENLAETLLQNASLPNAFWLQTKRYLEAMNGSGDPAKRITIPMIKADVAKALPGVLAWTQRFFDHGGPDVALGAESPWLATAYPRSGSPVYAAPDANGRMQYDHLIEDRWAHNYRYLIQPSGRYDLIWKSWAESPALWSGNLSGKAHIEAEESRLRYLKCREKERLERIGRAAMAGGLDLVLERGYPVDAPVVVRSGRLDIGNPQAATVPGRVWEVIVAQHPEQALVERNQTLARQLSYRQIAFSLIRRFADESWLDAASAYFNKKTIQDATTGDPTEVGLPTRLTELDHINPNALTDTAQMDEEQREEAEKLQVELALPTRIERFQQGAIVLQWRALPYYYEHSLLLIAQTTECVSAINQITQRDFEYCAPVMQRFVTPVTLTTPVDGDGEIVAAPSPPVPLNWKGNGKPYEDTGEPGVELLEDQTDRAQGIYRVRVRLARYWDCLSDETRQQWPSEMPVKSKVLYSSLPDPEVVYQIVESFNGNTEVQNEIYFSRSNGDLTNLLAVRNLGKRCALAKKDDSKDANLIEANFVDDYLYTMEFTVKRQQSVSGWRTEGELGIRARRGAAKPSKLICFSDHVQSRNT